MIFIAIVFASVLLGLTAIYWCFQAWSNQQYSNYFKSRGIQYIAQRSFIVVMLFKKNFQDQLHQSIQKTGLRLFGFNLFGVPTICIAIPELIQSILSKEFTNFPNRRKVVFGDEIFMNMLSVIEGEQWKRLRAIVTPTFATGKLRKMKPCLDEICRTLIKNCESKLKNSEATNIDVKPLAGAFTMDTVIQVAFGVKVDSLIEKNNPIITNARKLFNTDMSFKTMMTFAMFFVAPKISNKLGIRFQGEVIDFFKDFSTKIIQQKRQEFNESKNNFSRASTFIEFLLEAEHEYQLKEKKLAVSNGQFDSTQKTSKYITNIEMMAQCVLFFLAGYDTTATTITLSCYYLALNPDKQQLAYEEVEKLLKELQSEQTMDPYEKITFDSVSKFEYINGVVSETLRLSPPAPFVERRAMNDIVLESEDLQYRINIKRDDIINIPVWSLHYDEKHFPEPRSFRPERFIGEIQHHKYSYLPFGSGPRNCVARSLALLEAKLALIHLVRCFRFSPCEKTKIPFECYNQANFLSPKDIYLKIERRD